MSTNTPTPLPLMQDLLPLRDTLTRRFFRRAFGIFVAFAVLLTLVLVLETVWQNRENLKSEMAIYQRTFERSIAQALWAMDEEKLNSIVQGIIEIRDVEGVRIFDPEGQQEIMRAGLVPGEGEAVGYPLVHRFAVIHDEGFGSERVAHAEFHSSLSQVVERSQRQILMIVLLAILKTAALWWIFLRVGRRMLETPLNEMAAGISGANSARRLVLSRETEQVIRGTELAILRKAYDELTERVRSSQWELEKLNRDLELRVRERTRELEQANRELDTLAHTDSLTGLANRRQFITASQQVLALARRSGRPLSLIVCDIDKFKQINDLHGHAAGDEAICLVAQCLREAVREVDVVTRFGGDEFVILLPDIEHDEAYGVAERLRRLVTASRFNGDFGERFKLSLSIGVAQLQDNDIRLEDLFLRADARLYLAKTGGRNRVVAADTLEVVLG